MNGSTLKALRRCELGELPLSRCRGVSDDWLGALSNEPANIEIQDFSQFLTTHGGESISSSSSSSTSSFHSAISSPRKFEAFLPVREGNPILDVNMSLPSYDAVPQIHYNPTPSATTYTTLLDLRGSQKLTDKGLLHLKGSLAALEVVRLDDCHSLTGRGLVALSNSHQIHTLTLSNCRCLTDEAIANITHLKLLTVLSVDGCRCLTDLSLRSIGNLSNLRKLDLSQCDLFSDDALQYLGNITFLEEISLGWCRRISDKGVEIFVEQSGRKEYLRSLCLARCLITDVGVGHLARLKGLRSLDLNGCCSIKSAALGDTLGYLKHLEYLDVSFCQSILRSSWQGKINSLKSLDLNYAAVKDSHLSRLTSLPALEEINFDSCPIGDWSLSHLSDNDVVPNLKSLNLADCDVSDLGMASLPKFKKLRHLSLFYCNISNIGLRHLASMKSLETLNLDSRDISDDGLYFLRKLNLKCLDIFSGRITDIGCVHIGKIKSLETLELCGGNIGDLGCIQLAKNLKNLTSLNLAQNELITNSGASALSELSQLKALNLSHTRVNSEALRFFKELRELQSLAMYGCRGIRGTNGRTQNLHCQLPSLKCLRIDGSSKKDGAIDYSDDSPVDESSVVDNDDELSFGMNNESDESSSEEEDANAENIDDEDESIDHDVEEMHVD